MLKKLKLRWRALRDRASLDAELDDELRFHLEQQVDLYVSQGMDPQAARTEAMRLFGGVEKVKEECRDERRVAWVDGFVQDVTYAVRMLGKTKSFAIMAILTLALGIGANTAIFSVINGVLLEPLPYPDDDQLVVLQAHAPQAGSPQADFTILEFFEARAEIAALDLVEFHGMSFTLLGHGYPSSVSTGVVSADFFDVLGLTPQLGRTFVDTDDRPGAEAVLVLSDRYWRREFDADPGVIGQVFEMNDRPHRVIGVLPAIPHYPGYNDVYMPASACPFRGQWDQGAETQRDSFRSLRVLGRLDDGQTLEHARREVEAFAAELADRDPLYYEGSGFTVSAAPLREVLTDNARPMLLALGGTVLLVLLVTCANVANLMFARVMQRDREFALRAALGAGRGRMIRQLLTEATLLSLLGGALGLVFAALGLDLLVDFTGRFTARTTEIHIDGGVLVFTFAVSVLTGIAFGVLPGLWRRGDGLLTLREGGSASSTAGRRTLRARSLLIAAQVALSFVLLIAAGLMVNSFIKLTRVDAGFGADNLLTASVFPNWTEYWGMDAAGKLFTELMAALESAPGVASVAVANTLPFRGGVQPIVLLAEQRPTTLDAVVQRVEHDVMDAEHRRRRAEAGGDGLDVLHEGWPLRLYPFGVSSAYFETVGIDLVEGRGLTPAEIDDTGAVALISSSARDAFWPDRSPIGQRIAIGNGASDVWNWYEIVGVVADAKHLGLESAAPPAIFASYRAFGGGGQLLVRTTADAATMSAFIRETLARIAPRQSVQNFQTMATLRAAALATPRLTTTLISLFAVLATLITVTGIGGVIAFSVGQRRREIGIRMALGAERRAVRAMVVRQGLRMVAVGLAAGVVGALAFGSLLATFLFETDAADPLTFVVVGVLLLVATALACWLPARRATSIDPVVALRAD